MATETKRRLTPIIIRSRHFTATDTDDYNSSTPTSAAIKISNKNRVEFSNGIDQPNSQRRESFFQHLARRFSGSGANLLSVARAKPIPTPNTTSNAITCFSLATPSSSSSCVLNLQTQQSTFKILDNQNNDNGKRIGDRRLQAPRLSLLGKPIMYKPPRSRNAFYRVLQLRLYNFLERPRRCLAFFYHLSL